MIDHELRIATLERQVELLIRIVQRKLKSDGFEEEDLASLFTTKSEPSDRFSESDNAGEAEELTSLFTSKSEVSDHFSQNRPVGLKKHED